jgi:hypothetical protein
MRTITGILNAVAQWLAIVALGSVVLRRERAHRREEAAMRRTHDAIMRDVREPFDRPTGIPERIPGFQEPTVGTPYTETAPPYQQDTPSLRANMLRGSADEMRAWGIPGPGISEAEQKEWANGS